MMARAQRSDRMRRLGVLMSFASDDPEGQVRVAALRGGLEALGWVEGQNLRIDYRWTTGPSPLLQTTASELVEQMPDAIVVSSACEHVAERHRRAGMLFLLSHSQHRKEKPPSRRSF
jgi:putative ABC transport system substrate-binding protein